MELWDLYTRERQFMGRDHVRGEEMPDGCYHLVAHVWIRNSQGEYLISQRSASRPTFPLMWECVGGSLVKGEDSLTGALREVKEEVGIDLPPATGRMLFSEIRERYNNIVDVWLFSYDGDADLSSATTDEVAQTMWMDRDQIKELFDEGKMVPTLEYFFAKVADC